MRIIAEIEVDEELIKRVSQTDDLEKAITEEFGWLESSGMYMQSWEPKTEN